MSGERIDCGCPRDMQNDIMQFLFGLLLGNPNQGGPRGHHHDHGHHCPQPQPQPDPHCPPPHSDDCNTNPSGTFNGEIRIWGDPHVDGSVSVDRDGDGKSDGTINPKFDTKGGAGEWIELLDSSGRNSLDIDAKFISWNGSKDVTVVGEEHIDLNGHDIHIKPGEVTIDGNKIADGTYCCNGNSITKCGNTTTIKTASGETLTVVDKGGYLDTTLKLDNYSGKLDGMLGDAVNGRSDPNAMHYADSDMHIMDGCSGAGFGNNNWLSQMSPRDLQWAASVLIYLGRALENAGHNLGDFARFLDILRDDRRHA